MFPQSKKYVLKIPENSGKRVRSQMMDKHQMSQAGQRLFGITHLLFQEAGNLFSLQERPVHESGEGLPNRAEDVLYDT